MVDTSNYVPGRDGAIAEIDEGLPETAWVARQLGVPVVKAFNNIIAGSLAVGGARASAGRVALPVCSDDAQARSAVLALVEELGFDSFDGGSLADSWRQQPGHPAYCTDPTIEELPGLLQRADRDGAPARREAAQGVALRLSSTFPVDDLIRAARFSAGLDRWRPRTWMALMRLAVQLAKRHPRDT